jgi:uncharacterized protein (TIGR02996 family)
MRLAGSQPDLPLSDPGFTLGAWAFASFREFEMPLPETDSADWRQLLAFLQDCKEPPEDDAPRLILADWLEEHDDPRGEFLRLQVHKHRLPPLDERLIEMEDREKALLAEHGPRWFAGLARWDVGWTSYRGLLHVISQAADLFGPGWSRWVKSAQFAWVKQLRLSGNARTADIIRLAGLPALAHVASLDLWKNRIGDRAAAALAQSPHVGRLHTLNLAEAHLGPDTARALADSTTLTRLRHLILCGNPLGDTGAAALAASPALACLETLDLRDTGLTDAGAEALAGSPHLQNLRVLNVWKNRISGWRQDTLRVRFGDRVAL